MPLPAIYICVALLLIGATPLPYWYYTLLRLVAFAIFAIAAYVAFTRKRTMLPWLFGVLALVFNPIIKVHLPKEIWMVVDIAAGILLLATAKAVKADDLPNGVFGPSQDEKAIIPSRQVVTRHLEANSKIAKLAGIVIVAAVLIAIYAASNRHEPVPPHDSMPTSSQEPEAAFDAMVKISPEEIPPVGSGLALTAPQARWCVFEKARLEAMKEFMASDAEIRSFDSHLVRYDQRCSQFRYPINALEAIKTELNQEGKRLQSEGAERVFSLRSTVRTRE